MTAPRRQLPDIAGVLYGPSSKSADLQSGEAAALPNGGAATRESGTAATPQSGRAAESQITKAAKQQTEHDVERPLRRAAKLQNGKAAEGRSLASRMGTLREPYERRDGVKMVHVSYSLPVDLARELRVFTAGLDSGERGNFVAACLREGMKKGWPW